MGTTANFQRISLDLVSIVFMVLHWFPTLVLMIIVMIMSIKFRDTVPYTVVSIFLTCILLFSSVQLLQSQTIITRGWGTERVISSQLQTTSDMRFEYRLDLINVFQRNSSARLFLRDIETGEVKNIALPMDTSRIAVISDMSIPSRWITMEPADTSYLYIVTTENELERQLNAETYKVDIIAGIAVLYSGGSLTDVIRADTLQITSDGRIEYRLEFINPFQENSMMNLYLRCLETGIEKNISLTYSERRESVLLASDDRWSVLEPTTISDIYTLEVLDRRRGNRTMFRIDLNAETAERTWSWAVEHWVEERMSE